MQVRMTQLSLRWLAEEYPLESHFQQGHFAWPKHNLGGLSLTQSVRVAFPFLPLRSSHPTPREHR